MSQKYVIAYFIKPVESGYNFLYKEWPLHVTLLPNFIISDSLNGLIKNVSQIADRTAPFDIKIGEDARFGPNEEVLVSLIVPNESIKTLHGQLIAITKNYTFDTPQYINTGYRPHVTKQVSNELENGQIYRVDSMTLVDMYPDSDIERREIIHTFYFG